MTPASTRTPDRWTEARTGPGPLYPRNGKRPHTIQRTCDDTATWPPRRPADGQQRAALRREGDGTPRRFPGSDHPQSSHVLYGASEGFILLVPTRFTEVHISSPVSSMCLRAKDLEGTKVAVFPSYCAVQKVQTGSAAAGGHRRVATRKTTGDLTTRRGAGDPERRAEWTTVSRYGHLQSALVVVDACYARSGNRLHSVQPCVVTPLASHGDSSMASCVSVDAQTRRCDPTRSLFRKFTWSAERSISPAHPCPHGLWVSLRHPVSPGQRRVCCGHGDRVTTSRFPATAFV